MSKYIITDTCDVSTNIAKFETMINQRGASSGAGVQKQKMKDLPSTIVSSTRSKFETMGGKKAAKETRLTPSEYVEPKISPTVATTTESNSFDAVEVYAKEVSLLKEVVRKIDASNFEIVRELNNRQVESDYETVTNDVQSKMEKMDTETPINDALFQNIKLRYQEIIERLNDENARLQGLFDARNDSIAEDIKEVETVFQGINGEEEEVPKCEKPDAIVVESESVNETLEVEEEQEPTMWIKTTNTSETLSNNVDKIDVEIKAVEENSKMDEKSTSN